MHLSNSLVKLIPSLLWVARLSVKQPLVRETPELEAGVKGKGSGQGILGLCLWEAGQSLMPLVAMAIAGVGGEAKRNLK